MSAAATATEWYAALARRLEDLKKPTVVVPTRNRVRMVSFRQRVDVLEVRVSERVAALGDDSLDAVTAFVRGEEGGRAALRVLFERIPSTPAKPRGGISRGLHHDLEVLADEERRAHFAGLSACPVVWGPRRRPRRQKSIRLGLYDPRGPIIRIHSRLDSPHVPAFFVGFVIFHELLHHELGVPRRGSRTRVHSPEFRARERQHPRYDDAMTWERRELRRLLAGRL